MKPALFANANMFGDNVIVVIVVFPENASGQISIMDLDRLKAEPDLSSIADGTLTIKFPPFFTRMPASVAENTVLPDATINFFNFGQLKKL